LKLECSRKDLDDALSLAGSAVSVRNPNVILQTVRLEAKENELRVLGSDGEMWTERAILANVSQPGSICVGAKLLQDVVSALPDGQVSLDLMDTSLVLRYSASEWKFVAVPSEGFPSLPQVDSQAELRMTIGEVREAVSSVAYAVATDSMRQMLTGVLFRYDGTKLTLVATDTHRLAVRIMDKPGIGGELQFVVPDKALKAIRSLPLADGEEVVLRFDESRIGVDSGNARVTCQLLNGAFPAWERVLPQQHTRCWKFDRRELLDNLKRALILARDSANRVRIIGHGDKVTISAQSIDKGEGKEEVPVLAENGDFEIAFNCQFLIDAVGAMKGDGVRAEMTEASRQAVFRPTEDSDAMFCVVMPMALS
jgi:DNA polymerase-3 subunit beta